MNLLVMDNFLGSNETITFNARLFSIKFLSSSYFTFIFNETFYPVIHQRSLKIIHNLRIKSVPNNLNDASLIQFFIFYKFKHICYNSSYDNSERSYIRTLYPY